MRSCLLLLIAVLLPSAVRAEAPVVSFALPNGLRVAMQEDHRTPRVAVRVGYDVGWRDAPPGYPDLPHLFEHLMFTGSRHAPGDAFQRLLNGAGATDIDATTGADETEFHEIVPAHQLALALWLESDRMAFLLGALGKRQLDEQKKVVLGEDDTTQTADELRAITLRDVQWFGQRWYRPERAVLSLVGDFDPVEARALVERFFGPVVADPRPVQRTVSSLTGTGRTVQAVAPGDAATVEIIWPTPPALTADDAALDVLAEVLIGRLGQTLQREQPLCARVQVQQRSRALSSEFVIDAAGEQDIAPERIVQLIDEDLDRLGRSEVARPELDRAVGEVVAAETRTHRSLLGRAAEMAGWWRGWGDPDGYQRDLRRPATVTATDLRRVVTTLLRHEDRVVVIARPKEGSP